MNILWTAEGDLEIEAAGITLRRLAPVLNGAVLARRAEAVLDGAGGVSLRYEGLPGAGTFGVDVRRDPDGQWRLRTWLERPGAGLALDSFGLCWQAVENLRVFHRQGYHSWDGSRYVDPEAARDEGQVLTGYAMTQLLPRAGSGNLILGFERHDRFQHTFSVDASRTPPALTVLTLWDRKDISHLARCESEWLLFLEGDAAEDGLCEWARRVAQAMPARSSERITGWCSWYNLYGAITEDNILNHLRATSEVARRERLPMRVFQIDDGFTPEMGDWLLVKPQFPRGMKALLDDIRAQGFIPGLWIAPFMVGNRSRLYGEHPDWVVGDRLTGGPLAQMKLYGEFRWHKRSEEYYILDTTHPQALDYLRQVLRIWRREWGCEYFKTDFMFYGAEHGPDRAVRHRPGMTRIEIWRQVAQAIRAEIGDALWMGCGCPLWASVGLVDAVRIGRDVGVEWSGNMSAQSLLRDLSMRQFGNGILWQADPDCILLRDRFHHLSDAEVRSLALYAGMCGGVAMTSDDLGALSPDRLRLWKQVLGAGPAAGRFPLLGEPHSGDDPVLVQVRSGRLGDEDPVHAVLVFNTGDQPVQRTYLLEDLGLAGPLYVWSAAGNSAWPTPVDQLSVVAPPHDSVLLFLGSRPFTSAPEGLP